MKTLLATLVRSLSGLSLTAWLRVAAVVAVVSAGTWARSWHLAQVDAARVAVRDSITSAAAAVLPAAKETVYVAARATERARGAAVQSVERAADLALAVPLAAREAFPVVDTLVGVVLIARDSVRILSAAIQTERTAWARYQTNAELVFVAARDSLERERQRPKRTLKSNTVLVTVGAVSALAVRETVRWLVHRRAKPYAPTLDAKRMR